VQPPLVAPISPASRAGTANVTHVVEQTEVAAPVVALDAASAAAVDMIEYYKQAVDKAIEAADKSLSPHQRVDKSPPQNGYQSPEEKLCSALSSLAMPEAPLEAPLSVEEQRDELQSLKTKELQRHDPDVVVPGEKLEEAIDLGVPKAAAATMAQEEKAQQEDPDNKTVQQLGLPYGAPELLHSESASLPVCLATPQIAAQEVTSDQPKPAIDSARPAQKSPQKATVSLTSAVTSISQDARENTWKDIAAIAEASSPSRSPTRGASVHPVSPTRSASQQVSPTRSAVPHVATVAEECHSKDFLTVPMADTTWMTVEELRMDGDIFDPCRPQLRSLLLERLQVPQSSVIEALQDNPGSFNDGVWIVVDSNSTGLVLKLVPHIRQHHARATDTEKFINLQKQCPHIVTEFSLSFPLKIFQLRGPRGNRCKDLIVMRRATGLQLTQHMYHKINGGQPPQLLQIFSELGTFLHTLHRAYQAMQHGDCQPSNVFYDELTGIFTLIDVADLGYGPYVAEGGENDVEHFIDGLKTLSRWYGEKIVADCERRFRAAYLEAKSRPR
jgi:hypothetical protein